MRWRPLVLCSALLGAPAAEGTILWHGDAAGLRWDETLGWWGTPDVFSGFSDQPLPAVGGKWSGVRLAARGGSSGEASITPGEGPSWRGATFDAALEGGYVWAWGFALAEPLVRWRPGIDAGDVPNGDSRQIWSGSDPFPDQKRLELIPGGTIGVVGLRHVLAASAAPVGWGPGIFGSVVLGGGERGFPHAVLTTSQPWHLLDAASEPLLMRYELLAGVLDGHRTGPQDPLLLGSRLGLRWWAFEAGLSTARQAGGTGRSVPGWAWSPLWTPPTAEREERVDTVSSLDLSIDVAGALRLAGEYGVGHPLPDGAGDRIFGHYGAHAATWMGTLDWYDVMGDGLLRIAAEVRWCESGVYGNPAYAEGWTYRDQPLSHPDGDDARSLRLLIQSRLSDTGDASLILGALERGWRNVADANPNPDQPDPGGLGLPPRAWTTWSADARWGLEWTEWNGWIEVGGRVHRNQLFEDRGGELEGVLGIGAQRGF